ncbi:MAG: hypothetical protein IPM29_10720 [Planctomycetes bacterium]|nr:hypothetical protein [Planctomycetota bacterium]
MTCPLTPRGPTALAVAAALALVAPAAAQIGPDAKAPSPEAVAEALLAARNPARDDPDAIARALLDLAAQLAPDSPLGTPLIRAATDDLDDVGDLPALIDRLRALAERPLHGLAREALEISLEAALRRLGRFDEARAVDPLRHQASELVAIGPFGDSADFYLDAVYPPELEFPATPAAAPLQGRFGPVHSHVARRRPGSATIDLQPPGSEHDGAFYGLHRFELGADVAPATGYVEVLCASSFAVWLNDERITAVERTAERAPSIVFVPAVFRTGENRVLVKTAINQLHGVALRYLDARGRPLASLHEIPGSTPVAPLPAVTGELPPRPGPMVDAVARLARAADEAPAGAAAACAAWLSADARDADRSLALLARAEPLLDDLASLGVDELLGWARVYEAADVLPPELRQARLRRLCDAALERAPHHAAAVAWKASLLRAEDRPEEALRLLTAALDAEPALTAPALRTEQIRALEALGDDAGADLARAAWLAVAPTATAPRAALAASRARGGDFAGAAAALDVGLALLPGNRDLLRMATRVAAQRGDRGAALDFDTRLLAADGDPGDGFAALHRRAAVLRTVEDRRGLIVVLGEAAAAEDATPANLAEVGAELVALGADVAGRDTLRLSLERDPSQHALRRELDRLDGAADYPLLARFRIGRDEVDAMVAGFTVGEREATAPSTVLLDRMVVWFLPDGSRLEEVHQVRRINDRSGVEAFEQQADAARADAVLRLRTIGVDGATYLPTRVQGSFAMPRVEPGAFLEALYRREVAAPAEEPWRGAEFWFQSDSEPFARSELIVVLPPDAPGSFRRRGLDDVEVEETNLGGGFRVTRFLRRDAPRLVQERRAPPSAELIPSVTYGEDRGADAARRAARAIFTFRTQSSPWVAAATARVVAGIDGDLARAQAIHRFVHDLVTSERGTPEPTAILLRRQGSRYFLEVAMLREAGIPLRGAAAAEQREELDDAAPSPFVGDDEYPVPAVRIEPRDGPPLWLFDDVPRHAPLGFLPAPRAGAAVLMVDTGETLRLPLLADQAPGWDVTASGALAATGAVTMTAEARLRDAQGLEVAQQVRDIDANRRGVAGQQLGSRVFPGWRLQRAALPVPEPGERFVLRCELERRSGAESVGDELRVALPMPTSELLSRYGDRGERELPFDLREQVFERWEIALDVDPALRVVRLPEPCRVRCAGLDYTLRWSVDGARLVVRRELLVRPFRLPASRFAEWLAALARVDAAEALRPAFHVR